MLHIVRKKGESITIDGGITIKIIDLDANHVRLGVEAPRKIGIYRQELYEKICNENAMALQSAASLDELALSSKDEGDGV